MPTGLARSAVIVSIPMALAAALTAWRGLETRGRRLEDLADHGTEASPVPDVRRAR
jgi:hypothetical protein